MTIILILNCTTQHWSSQPASLPSQSLTSQLWETLSEMAAFLVLYSASVCLCFSQAVRVHKTTQILCLYSSSPPPRQPGLSSALMITNHHQPASQPGSPLSLSEHFELSWPGISSSNILVVVSWLCDHNSPLYLQLTRTIWDYLMQLPARTSYNVSPSLESPHTLILTPLLSGGLLCLLMFRKPQLNIQLDMSVRHCQTLSDSQRGPECWKSSQSNSQDLHKLQASLCWLWLFLVKSILLTESFFELF